MPSAGTALDGHNWRIFQVQLPSPVGQPALAQPTGGNALRRHGPRRPQLANFSSSTSEPCRPTSSGSADRWQCPPPARPSTATTGEFFKFNFRALSANQLWLSRPVAMPSAGTALDGHNWRIFQVQLPSPVGQPALAPPTGGSRRRRAPATLGETMLFRVPTTGACQATCRVRPPAACATRGKFTKSQQPVIRVAAPCDSRLPHCGSCRRAGEPSRKRSKRPRS